MRSRVLQIRPSTDCPARCATCTTLVRRGEPDLTVADIQANLDHFPDAEELVFSGAEITTRADLREILELVRRRRFRLVTLLSSGLAWTDDLARACAGVIDRVVVALTPQGPADWASGLGRSATVRRSIATLRRASLRVQSNTVVTTGSVQALDGIAEAIERLDVEQPIFLFPFATGGADAVRRARVPAWSDVEPAVARVLERLESRGARLKNVPPCAAPALARFIAKTTPRVLVERGRERERHGAIPPFVGMRFDAACASCSLAPRCDGYWPAHVEAGILPPPWPPLPSR